MATDKPRFSITMEQTTFDTFKRFAQLSGKPLATIISQLLTQARPQFEKLGVLLQQSHELQSRTKQQQADFLAKIDVMAQRSESFAESTYSDLVTTIGGAPAKGRGAAATKAGNQPKTAPHSLIHRNKVPKPQPKRVPAILPPKKGGRRASST